MQRGRVASQRGDLEQSVAVGTPYLLLTKSTGRTINQLLQSASHPRHTVTVVQVVRSQNASCLRNTAVDADVVVKCEYV